VPSARPRLIALPLACVLLASACSSPEERATPADEPAEARGGWTFAAAPKVGAAQFQESPALRAQVALSRLGFSPGAITMERSPSTRDALRAYQEARGLETSGELDRATQMKLFSESAAPATRRVAIPESFVRQPLTRNLPEDMRAKADLPHIGYERLIEALAERFHTTPATLIALNGPGTVIRAGAAIRVPYIPDPAAAPGDIGEDWAQTLNELGVSAQQPQAERLVVDKSEGWLRAYDAQGRIVAHFPVTTGSEHDPLPIGTWTIRGVARNPDYVYNPELFWDASDSGDKATLPPGPNGPVGVVWIDLSKEHYGIHGTPEPANIGKTQSHGCVRLTNWDAARLAQMVKPGVKAEFRE
jgi:lipoprotein-anchoring transpeptidase ErfK/SrfK